MRILNFFDDDHQLWGRTIEGVPIKSFNEIELLNDNGDVYRLDRVVELDKHLK